MLERIGVSPLREEGGVVGLSGDKRGVKVGGRESVEKESVGEGKDTIVVMGASVVVGTARQSVGAIGGAGFVKEPNVVVAEGQDVAGKAAVNFLGAAVVLEVLVVGEDVDDEFGAQQEVAPVFERTDDGKEFTVPDRIVSFGFSERRGIVSDRVTQAVRVSLVEDGARSELGGVHFKLEGFGMIGLAEDRVGGGEVDETIKSRGAFWSPDEGCPFLEEV